MRAGHWTSANPSRTARSGTCQPCSWRFSIQATATAALLCVVFGQPLLDAVGWAAAGAAVTTAVGTLVALFDPSLFLAVTTTRSVLPLSTLASWYVLFVAPEMFEQLPPFWSQRRHWYV